MPSPQAPTEDFPNPREAAIAAALAQDPSLENPSVSRMVVIYADSTIVDLRVQVQAGGFCHWYGVVGRVDNGELRWDGGPAIACEG
ncbi:MAG: hypothetical protein ACRDXD_13005 [Acidimicrobiia bacterium]